MPHSTEESDPEKASLRAQPRQGVMAVKPPSKERPATTTLLGVTSLAALTLGFSLSVFGYSPFPNAPRGTPQTRVGFALQKQHSSGDQHSWEQLRRDVRAVRHSLPEERRTAFDLVAALRGLEERGEPDWAAAKKSCQALGWPRCDRQLLETLRESAQP